MTVGGATISLVPQTGGLALDAELDTVNIGMHLDYAAACIDGSRDITIAAIAHLGRSGTLDGRRRRHGAFDIQPRQPERHDHRLRPRARRHPGRRSSTCSISTRALGPILGWATEKFVVPMLNTSLAGLNNTKTVDVLGTMVDIVGPAVAARLLDARARSSSSTRRCARTATPATSSTCRTPLPAMDLSQGFQLAVADDAANQLLTSMRSAKGLDKTLDLKTGPYGDIGQLYDSVEIAAAVPPFVDAVGPAASCSRSAT